MRVVSTPMKKRPSKRGSDRKAGFCSRRSGGKIMHVLFLWWSCWTDGATVDACSQHADEEASIEARVRSEGRILQPPQRWENNARFVPLVVVLDRWGDSRCV